MPPSPHSTENPVPVKPSERLVVLDALRGFAVLGICLANYPEFSLFTFQSAATAAAMPTAALDNALRFLLFVFVDGKFYTLFSLLFGVGFSIILANAEKKGADGRRVFLRRMAALALFGFLHLMFVWSGDILLLYALLGMLLPFFKNVSGKKILATAAFFLLLPIAVDAFAETTGVRFAEPAVRAQLHFCGLYGITDENFGTWLRDAKSYGEVFEFLVQGALVRVQEFVDGNRYFKVFGLFLIGFLIGRARVFADLGKHVRALKRGAALGLAVGLPLSLLYAWSATGGRPLGNAAHTALGTFSILPTAAAYACAFCLLYLRRKDAAPWRFLAAPGRTALTNYIAQSLVGMFLFYGIGLGLGARFGLAQTELIALGVFLSLALLSRLWLRVFRFGPLEWLWRMLTYGRRLGIRNAARGD